MKTANILLKFMLRKPEEPWHCAKYGGNTYEQTSKIYHGVLSQQVSKKY